MPDTEHPSVIRSSPPHPVPYAFYAAIGTWKYRRPPCPTCEWHWQYPAEPLLVQWEPYRDNIGDFSYNGPTGEYNFIVTDQVARFFEQRHFPCELRRIEYVKPRRRGKLPCVPFPYQGPRQLWPECTSYLELDQEASGVKLESSCPDCGDVRHTFRYEGIVIPKNNWSGEPMFRIKTNGWSAATFITADAKRQLEDAGFTNLLCRKAGQITE